MTDEEKVKAKYPDAYIDEAGVLGGSIYIVVNGEDDISNSYRSVAAAWADAARKLDSAQ